MPGLMADPSPDPDDEQVDQIFSRMTEDLGMEEQNVLNCGDVVVSSLSDLELLNKFNECKTELKERSEILNPRTQTGRDLHSVYSACLVELKKRKIL